MTAGSTVVIYGGGGVLVAREIVALLERSIPLDNPLRIWYPWCSGSARLTVAQQVSDRNREDTPMPQKKTVTKMCEECGISFLVTKITDRKGQGRFCSISCASKEKARKYLPIGKSGEENPAWRGGLTKSSKGYWYVQNPEHPRAMKSGYVKRASLVMEEKLGRPLLDGEMVHHIDGVKDNDSPENLELFFSLSSHTSKHMEDKRKSKVRNPDHPNNRRYLWPSDKKLLVMRQTMTLRALAKVIGCNHKAVDRRIKKIQG